MRRLLAPMVIALSLAPRGAGGDPCLSPERIPGYPIKGITIAPIEDGRLGPVGYGSEACRAALAEVADVGATWVSLTPFGRMEDLGSTEVLHDFEIPAARNEELIRRSVEQAREAGLRVAIIPHVWVVSGEWRGRIDPGGDDAWAEWFDSYERFALRFAALAEETGADLFSVGVEMASSTNSRPDDWRRLVARVRDVYRGPLTYSANWDEAADVEFWDDLDAIAVNAFWPLATGPGAGLSEMGARAEEVAEELEALAYVWNRPVLFAEVGFKSARDSAIAPWEWPEHCGGLVYDEEYQAAAHQAVLEAMVPREWFAGLFVWKYFSDPEDHTQEERAGFSPRGKLAEEVLSRWFSRSWGSTAEDIWVD